MILTVHGITGRDLTAHELDVLCSRPGVDRRWVRKFLRDVDIRRSLESTVEELSVLASREKWGSATSIAIVDGIKAIYGNHEVRAESQGSARRYPYKNERFSRKEVFTNSAPCVRISTGRRYDGK